MNKPVMAGIAAGILVLGLVLIPLSIQQYAEAKRVVRFIETRTVESMQDPGQGHETHQINILLPPKDGVFYSGRFSWTASAPVEVVMLHDLKPGDKAPFTYTIDGEKKWALSLIFTGGEEKGAKAGAMPFVGAALALHTLDGTEFTATVSIHGQSRAITGELKGEVPGMMPPKEMAETPKETPKVTLGELQLSRQSLALKLPLLPGFYNGETVHFIATESSDMEVRDSIHASTKFNAVYAPVLADAPVEATSKVYVFTRATQIGPGIMGGQLAIFDSTPAQTEDYSPLRKLTFASWTITPPPTPLTSVEEIMSRVDKGEVTLEETGIVLNLPMIVWPEGQMMVREQQSLALSDQAYGGGQILSISQKNRAVTFVAHRGWGPDGNTIYYIVTDATPKGPADMMGVVYAPKTEALALTPVAVDLFQFANGIKGGGPMGFQPGIAAADTEDENYSPMWRISFITWKEDARVRVLEAMHDIEAHSDSLTVELAMEGMHVVNCPFLAEIPKAQSGTGT